MIDLSEVRGAIKKRDLEQKALETKMNTKGSSQPVSNKQPDLSNNWSRFMGDMSHDRQQLLDFGDGVADDLFKNALNGQFKSSLVANKKTGNIDDKTSIVNRINGIGEKAWQLASLVKTYSTKEDFKKIEKLKVDFNNEMNEIRALADQKKDTFKMVFDAKGRLISEKRDAYLSQQPKVLPKMGNNTLFQEANSTLTNVLKDIFIPFHDSDTSAIEALDDKNSGLRSVNVDVRDMKGRVGKAHADVVSSWLTYGFGAWGTDAFGSETAKHDNKTNILDLSIRSLDHIAKYGDSSLSKDSKKEANTLLNYINAGKTDAEQKKRLKEKEGEVTSMVTSMGLYGQTMITDKYKTVFNSDYYKGGKGSKESQDNMTSMLNEITTLTEQQKKTDASSKAIKQKAIDETLLNIRANKKEYTPEKTYSSGGSTLTMGTSPSDNSSSFNSNAETPDDNIDDFVSNFIFDVDEKGNSITSRENSFKEVYKKMHSSLGGNTSKGYWSIPVKKGVGNKQDEFGNQHLSYNALRDAYDRVTTQYHEKVNNTSFGEIFKNSLAVVGFGKKGSYMLRYENLDSNNDSGKNENFTRIKNIIRDNKTAITVASGGYDHGAIESRLDEASEGVREKMFNDFLKDEGKYALTFSRESPIKGKSAYVFTPVGKNQKSTTFYIDTKLAEDNKEALALGTKGSPQERSYQHLGKWDLTAWNSNYKYSENATITTIQGSKYLIVNAWDIDEEKTHRQEIYLGPDGSTTIDDAEKKAKTILDNNEQDLRNYYTK